ncbi:MAG: D-alanyl-D-alanine carboxypeptidase/D-alanyl-D-alanine-endopeptidase [Polyangiaceae bacterium]
MRAFVRVTLFTLSLCAATWSPIAETRQAFAAEPEASGSNPTIEAAVRTLVADKGVSGAQIGVTVLDVDSGRVLAQHDERTVLNPASNAKVYTAAAALSLLHGNHRYQTTLYGTIKGSSVEALTLRGYGDPSLKTDDFISMARDLYNRGVRKVDGDLSLDQRFFDDQTTPPAFEQQPNEWAPFRAPVSALAVNENTVTLTVRPGGSGGSAHYSFDPPGFVDAEGSIKTTDSGADNVGLAMSANGSRLKAVVSGSVGQDSKIVRYTRRVEDPQLLAGYVLKFALEQQGIKVAGDIKLATGDANRGTLLAKHESDPLGQLLYALGKQSDNFYAEMVFKSLSAELKGKPGKSQSSAEIVQKWLDKNKLSDAGLVIKNGSGLFDANRVSTHSITELLRFMWRDTSVQSEFVAQFAIGGVDGTLAKRFRTWKSSRAIRAKTGTLDDVIALSGYVLSPSGKGPIAFSIIFNKVTGKGGAARVAADKLVEAIAKDRWRATN